MMPEAWHIVAFPTIEKLMTYIPSHCLRVFILTVLIVGAALLGLVACGTDGPDEVPPPTVESPTTKTPVAYGAARGQDNFDPQ